MSNKNTTISAEEAWKKLIEKYDIVNKIKKDGVFHISASQIKEFKEPRLMAKWDSSDQLPPSLKHNKINILPDSRSSYILGDFILYEDIPELTENVKQMTFVELPSYESIDVNNISSEANAINVLILSGILDDFLETDENVSTFNGRMGTGSFDFKVNTYRNIKRKISVNNAQCEIDGGFENSSSVIIMEAKNVLHSDFHVRQLYYPYRAWINKVSKPVRLVFSIYSNKIYRLFEYKFEDINDYSSIKLVKYKNYSLQDTRISIEEIISVRKNTKVLFDDNCEKDCPPFIQADSFERVISLLENLYDNPMDDEEIAELMQFGCNYDKNGKPAYRQSQYYVNAGKYLGLFEKIRQDGKIVTVLTTLGKKVYKMQYKERQLKLVSLMLEHKLFMEMFDYSINHSNELPPNTMIRNRMKELNVCKGEQLIVRRSQSVRSWLKWIFNLIQ